MKSQRLTYAPTRSRRLNEVFGLAVLVAAGLLLLALVSYNPVDPSLNTVGDGLNPAHPAHNWTGLIGAYFADLALQTLGVAVLLVPLVLGRVGVSWLRSRPVGAGAVKGVGLLLWLVFAPAGVALLPLRWLWRGALPLAGVEGRVLADGLTHLLNAPGAAMVTALMVALSLYLATSFALVSAPEWFTGHFQFLRNGQQGIALWRYRRRNPEGVAESGFASTRGRPRETGDASRVDPDLTDSAQIDSAQMDPTQTDAAHRNSLLAGFLRFFSRRTAADSAAETATAIDDGVEQPSVWGGIPRTDVDAPDLSGLAAASAAAAPYAAQLAAAAAPLRPVATEAEHAFDHGSVAPAPITIAPRVDDGWLEAPERPGFAPLLNKAAETPMAESVPGETPAGPKLVKRSFAAVAAEPAAYGEASLSPSQPTSAPLPAPELPQMRERPVAAAPVRAASPLPTPPARPSPMADIAAQNIAFGARADAHVERTELRPKSIKGYKLPPSSLLHQGEGQTVVREDALRAEAQVLVEKCAEFGVAGRVEQINPGPVVTTFEFRPDAGVKYSRVTGLADDLCLAMAAESILIERMAGKSTVGIQVPNAERETIWLRDVVESEFFAAPKFKLPIALGKDIDGRIVTADLASMPHVLIAGSTGSGKSVAINAMIMSVLFRSTPEQVRMILVDPKRVELGMYEGIPHLFTPIITEAKLAANALKNAVREMERRLKLLAANHVRNIDQFNKLFEHGSEYLFEDVNQEPLPYIIIVIDELADLMMLDRANVEEAITRLAQMARAVGIHLVLATQRPSVDVITGLLKANVPTRMSFRLATKIDSRTIIDTNGAESLLGRGDMLFLPPGTSRLQRVHAPFVTEKEIAAVTSFWRAQGEAEYVEGFLEGPKDEKEGSGSGSANEGEDADPMFDDAVRLVFEFGKASTSLLQRRLRIGYGRAAHLIDMMERDGLVGPADGSKPRELLKPPSYFSEVDAAIR